MRQQNDKRGHAIVRGLKNVIPAGGLVLIRVLR